MAGSVVQIDGLEELEWFIEDGKLETLMTILDSLGVRREDELEPPNQHTRILDALNAVLRSILTMTSIPEDQRTFRTEQVLQALDMVVKIIKSARRCIEEGSSVELPTIVVPVPAKTITLPSTGPTNQPIVVPHYQPPAQPWPTHAPPNPFPSVTPVPPNQPDWSNPGGGGTKVTCDAGTITAPSTLLNIEFTDDDNETPPSAVKVPA